MANTKIYIGNLNKSVTSEMLQTHFSQYGEINEVLLPVDRKNNAVKGYAFISFNQAESATNALTQDGETVFDQDICVQIATTKERGKKKS